MGSIRASILACWSNESDDDILVSALQAIVVKYGNEACQTIFQILASLELPEDIAGKYWEKVLENREILSTTTNRKVHLLPALCDFLASQTDLYKSPKIIESSTYSKIVEETTHDSLTSLFNRPYFNEIFEQNLSLAKRYNTDLCILFLDVDNFKEINDTYGHLAGDEALQAIAKFIKEEKRDSDIAARYGGEEFVLLMPHTDNLSGYVLAERIRNRIEKEVFIAHGKTYNITVSGGLASYPNSAKTAKTLLTIADAALYLAKGAGKNNIALYKEEKRRYLRVKFTKQLQIKELGFDSSLNFSGVGKDICIGGILFQNDQAIPIGSRIQVSIPINNKDELLLIGTVVRIEVLGENRYDIGMAMSFKEMDKIANNEIANFLRSNKTG